VELSSVVKRCLSAVFDNVVSCAAKSLSGQNEKQKIEIDAILVRRRQSFLRQPRYHFS
jgi:hypothetical protein